MKQKLFFLLYSMNVGGVEKSFLGLLSTLPPEQYEIHVGLFLNKGGFLEQLPSYVQIHDCCSGLWDYLNDPPIKTIRKELSLNNYLYASRLLLSYLYYKVTGSLYYFYDTLMRKEPSLDIYFDKAYAFAGPSGHIDYYICKKIRAREKFGWIHFDVNKFGIDYGIIRKLYVNYKKIFVVSNQGKHIFDEIFPEFRDKTEVKYNVVSREQCLLLAQSAPTYKDAFNGIRILTVGRLSIEKGQDVAIDTLKILLDMGYNVKWYFVGDGTLCKVCKEKAYQLGLSDRVVFLGVQTNPYGYMRDCDIYVQPSRHEGYCITLAEARCFTAPIIATNFTGAEEQLYTYPKSAVTGMSAEAIAEGIKKFL